MISETDLVPGEMIWWHGADGRKIFALILDVDLHKSYSVTFYHFYFNEVMTNTIPPGYFRYYFPLEELLVVPP